MSASKLPCRKVGNLHLEHREHALGAALRHLSDADGLFTNGHDVPATLSSQLEFATNPIARISAAIQSTRREEQKEVRAPGDFREYLARPCARIDAIHIEEGVVPPVFQRGLQRSRERLADSVSPIADENGLGAQRCTILWLIWPDANRNRRGQDD